MHRRGVMNKFITSVGVDVQKDTIVIVLAEETNQTLGEEQRR
jgi:hypothetical protein